MQWGNVYFLTGLGAVSFTWDLLCKKKQRRGKAAMDARRTPQSVGTAIREDGTGRTEECPKKAAKLTSECKAEKREPHEVEIRLLARELQALSEHMEGEQVISSIQTFVAKFPRN